MIDANIFHGERQMVLYRKKNGLFGNVLFINVVDIACLSVFMNIFMSVVNLDL